jgi:hypothetical protein
MFARIFLLTLLKSESYGLLWVHKQLIQLDKATGIG